MEQGKQLGSVMHDQQTARSILRKGVCTLIRVYQLLISPCMRQCCRFYPSCSQYTLMAVAQWGILKGLWIGLKRILRCHPWSTGGYDPIIPNDEIR
jgi:uncharacterized protein